jgi:hypothetical protein
VSSDRIRLGRFAALLVALLAIAAAGCGGGGAEADREKDSDVALLDAALSRELATLDAYTRGRAELGPLGRRLRAHQQEYANGLTKAIRGLGGEAEAEPEELDLTEVEGRDGFLRLGYELESASLAASLDAVPLLNTAAPRALAASLAAGHAQHLVLLRLAQGVDPGAAAPEAFDGGVVPPPAPLGG